MADHSSLAKGLREILLAMIAGTSHRNDLNRLIAVSHSLAASFLASKATTGSLMSVHDLSTSDLAYDCIADLFQQDTDGDYLQLQAYFAGLSFPTARDEEILAHLRRLVFSKVNQSIFRLYSEADPSLAKVLRNIKLAIHSLKNFEEIERFGEPCIVPSLCDTLVYLPPFERDDIEHCFLHVTRGNELIPDLLAKLSLFLRGQDEHCRILPLVGVGLLFRSVYEKKELPEPQHATADESLISLDANAIIQESCADVQLQMHRKYVGSGKVPDETFGMYFHIIREELCERFLGRDGHESSLVERLQQRLPGLTREEYSGVHRNRIEYLLKLVDKKAMERLKKI